MGVVRKKLLFWVFALFMPPLFPVDIRGADRPGQSALPLVDHSEFGDLKSGAPECLLMGSGMPGPRPECGRPLL